MVLPFFNFLKQKLLKPPFVKPRIIVHREPDREPEIAVRDRCRAAQFANFERPVDERSALPRKENGHPQTDRQAEIVDLFAIDHAGVFFVKSTDPIAHFFCVAAVIFRAWDPFQPT